MKRIPSETVSRAALGFLLLSIGGLAHFSGACASLSTDEFECGRPLETDTTRAKVCDRPSESCICKTNRCAIRNPECDSGLEYSFGYEDESENCVPTKEAETAFTQRAGASKFCPGYGGPLPCGVENGSNCGTREVCVCSNNRCAEVDTTSCPSGYRYAGADDCVDPLDARPEVLLFSGAEASCPSEDPPSKPCGVSHDGEPAVACGAATRCVCANNIFQCAQLSPGCPSGYAFLDGSCVRDLTAAQIEDTENQVDENGICPQYVPRDAGTD